jgi:hypothetical protein
MILYDTTVRVKRRKAGSGNVRHYVATATGEAAIQPVAKEPNAIADGQYGTLYVAYVEIDLPAQAGDQLVDPRGVVYTVKEVIRRDSWPFPHQELTLTKERT